MTFHRYDLSEWLPQLPVSAKWNFPADSGSELREAELLLELWLRWRHCGDPSLIGIFHPLLSLGCVSTVRIAFEYAIAQFTHHGANACNLPFAAKAATREATMSVHCQEITATRPKSVCY